MKKIKKTNKTEEWLILILLFAIYVFGCGSSYWLGYESAKNKGVKECEASYEQKLAYIFKAIENQSQRETLNYFLIKSITENNTDNQRGFRFP